MYLTDKVKSWIASKISREHSFSRDSIKAVIRDDQGRILVVREGLEDWELPGGGWRADTGETIHQCLARELREELGITAEFTETFIGAEKFFSETRQFMRLWLIYEVTFDQPDAIAQIQRNQNCRFANQAELSSTSPETQLTRKYAKH
jgi:mutator protein MutT